MPTTGDYAARWKDKGLKGWENIYELTARSSYDALRPWFPARRDLAFELGCADGVNTIRIAADFATTIVIDFSRMFLKMAQSCLAGKNVHYVHSTVEDYDEQQLTRRFTKVDAIFALNILEHLEDPVFVLKKYAEYLRPGGRILVAVPNARSFHRQLGVKMGLLKEEHALNAQDTILGHHRVYDMESLSAHLDAAGLECGEIVGNYVKPLSARQMNDWSPDILDGLEKLGKRFVGLSADLCVAAWPK